MHSLYVGLVLLLLNSQSWTTSGQTLDEAKTLMSNLLTGYDKRHRPVLNQSLPITVNVTMDLISVRDFDEVEEKFSVVAGLYITWVDESLVWNPASYGGIISQLYRVKDIWYPILVLANPYEGIKDIVETWMEIRVYASGFAFFVPGAVFEATCSVDVTYYPFDTQICNLLFVPWAVGTDEMILRSASENILLTYFSENGEWDVVKMSAQDGLSVGANMLTFTFHLKRKPMFLIVNVILPIIFMVAISVFVFVLPPESGERVSYSITVLLALAVFFTLISENLPKTSTPMSHLSYFLMISLILSTLMCILAILNLCVFHKKDDVPIPKWVIAFTRVVKGKSCRKCKSSKNDVEPFDSDDIPVKKKMSGPLEKVIQGLSPVEKETPVTWHDVSSAIDFVCLVLFSLAIVGTCTAYLIILTTNTS